jgi:hypothetical protein
MMEEKREQVRTGILFLCFLTAVFSAAVLGPPHRDGTITSEIMSQSKSFLP